MAFTFYDEEFFFVLIVDFLNFYFETYTFGTDYNPFQAHLVKMRKEVGSLNAVTQVKSVWPVANMLWLKLIVLNLGITLQASM